MAYNTKKFDLQAEYSVKSTKELQEVLTRVEGFMAQRPQFATGANVQYVQAIRSILAARIGRK